MPGQRHSIALAAALAASACTGTTVVADKLDVLFVIDNSNTMREKQAALSAALPSFTNRLAAAFGELPSLHVAVISTDVGVESAVAPGCSTVGDDGLLQTTPRIAGCTPPNDHYIIDLPGPTGTRVRNYDGDLPNTIACIASLGIGGCQVEQPLEALKRALDGRHPENDGFLRNDARLLVIILTDEDDCSLTDPSILDPKGGITTSFPCFQEGVRCDPDAPAELGEKSDCAPRDNSTHAAHVDDYVTFLQGLKPDPHDIVVTTISGDPTPVVVGLSPLALPELEASCSGPTGSAAPAVRLAGFVSEFGALGKSSSICSGSLDQALSTAIAATCDCTVTTGDRSYYACDSGTGVGLLPIFASVAIAVGRRRRLSQSRLDPERRR